MKINILTRTSGRPNYFKRCVDSIRKQTHKDINHIVCVDDEESFAYASGCADKVIRVERRTRMEKYGIMHAPYNLYMNALLDEVESGWVFILDDDDYLGSEDSLEKIVKTLPPKDSLVIFKTQFPGRTIPGPSFGKGIAFCDITSNSFMFHSDHIWAAKFDEVKEADFRCAFKLGRVLGKIHWVDQVVAFAGNQDNNNAAGSGDRNDLQRRENK